VDSALPPVVRHGSAVPCASDSWFWASPLDFQALEGVAQIKSQFITAGQSHASQQLAEPDPILTHSATTEQRLQQTRLATAPPGHVLGFTLTTDRPPSFAEKASTRGTSGLIG
jgi:hypothetical protein